MMTMILVTEGTVEDKLRFIFKAHDLDGDGFISIEELNRIYSSLFRSEGISSDEQDISNRVQKLVHLILEKADRAHLNAINEDGKKTNSFFFSKTFCA
jgi:Ca2+-binding EF-hand superfamily protein